ncbi:hypothetical protein RRG08_005782, partial [Elysia crispata]
LCELEYDPDQNSLPLPSALRSCRSLIQALLCELECDPDQNSLPLPSALQPCRSLIQAL